MPIAVFVCLIVVTNIVGAFIEEVSEMRETFPSFFVFPPPPGLACHCYFAGESVGGRWG
jgi:hypothetical protein